MIVRETEDGPKTLPSQSSNPSTVPQSLGYLSPDLQERLILATANKLLGEYKACLKSSGDTQSLLLRICAINCSVTSKCRNIQLWSIFHHNCKAPNDLDKLHVCFGILEKYGHNLLKRSDVRPAGWHAISVRNNSFSNKVDTVQGARDILKEYGYSVETPDGLNFPEGTEPIVDLVVTLVAELSVVKSELELYIYNHHPYPKHWHSLVAPQARIVQLSEGGEDTMANRGLISALVQQFDPLLHQDQAQQPQPSDDDICDHCGTAPPALTCNTELCESKRLCQSCDTTWHSHPRRKEHKRVPYAHKKKVRGFNYLGGGDCTQKYVTTQPKPVARSEEPVAKDEWMESGIYAEIADTCMDAGSGVYKSIPALDSIPLPPKPSLPPRPLNLLKPSEMLQAKPGQSEANTNPLAAVHSPITNPDDLNYYMSPVKMTPSKLVDLPSPHTANIAQGIIKGNAKISQFIEELKAVADPIEKKRRAVVMTSEFIRKIDQFGQELKQILKNNADFESNTEYKRLIGEKSRLERNRLLLEEYIRELDDERRQHERMLEEPPNYDAPKPDPSLEVEDIAVQISPSSKFCFDFEEMIPQVRRKTTSQGRVHTQDDDVVEVGVDVFAELGSWECEHCTMHNSSAERVCSMCDKTSDNPVRYGPPQTKATFESGGSKSQSSPQLSTAHAPTAQTSPDKRLSYSSQAVTEEQDEIYILKQKAKEEWERKQQGLPPLHSERNEMEPVPALQRDTTLPLDLNLLIEQPQFRPEPEYMRQTLPSKGRHRHHSEETRALEHMARDARAVASVLKTAESRGVSLDDVEIALVYTVPSDVMDWITGVLPSMLVNLVDTTKSRLPDNLADGLTTEKARLALVEADGNFDLAVTMCVARRQSVIDRLFNDAGAYSKQQVVQALCTRGGDEAKARVELQRTQCDALRQNIWRDVTTRDDVTTHCDITDGAAEYRGLETVLKNKQQDFERRARMVLAEAALQGWGRAENVIKLLDEDLAVTCAEVIHAVKDRGDFVLAREFLQQECCMCFAQLPANQILTLSTCECRTCETCMKIHFEVIIKERHVKNLICPSCQQPDIEDVHVESRYLEILTMFLRGLLSGELYGLYEDKLRDWQLQKDENFRWCSNCPNGFIFNPQGVQANRFKMTCGKCNTKTCFKCKRKWEVQHDGMTCAQFTRWQEENDPEFQREGLARHLQQNGIDCPKCKMKFSLAKGGCMHFKCTQCGSEFCCGCNQAFTHGAACKEFADCAKAGLHCHHPRDCLYFLRDETVEDLQKLLQDNDVNFQVENQDNEKCLVMEQKDTPDGLKDEPCARDVDDGQAGLCSIHYKEYLVTEINRHHIDPIDLMDSDRMRIIYTRHKTQPPKLKRAESEAKYAKRLREDLKQRFPLPRQAVG